MWAKSAGSEFFLIQLHSDDILPIAVGHNQFRAIATVPDAPGNVVFADAVMFEIAQLSGQKYVNTYAGSDDTPEAPPKPIGVPPGRKISARPTLAAAS